MVNGVTVHGVLQVKWPLKFLYMVWYGILYYGIVLVCAGKQIGQNVEMHLANPVRDISPHSLPTVMPAQPVHVCPTDVPPLIPAHRPCSWLWFMWLQTAVPAFQSSKHKANGVKDVQLSTLVDYGA